MQIHPDVCSLLCEKFNNSSEGLFFIAKDMWLDASDAILFELKFINFKEVMHCIILQLH